MQMYALAAAPSLAHADDRLQRRDGGVIIAVNGNTSLSGIRRRKA